MSSIDLTKGKRIILTRFKQEDRYCFLLQLTQNASGNINLLELPVPYAELEMELNEIIIKISSQTYKIIPESKRWLIHTTITSEPEIISLEEEWLAIFTDHLRHA